MLAHILSACTPLSLSLDEIHPPREGIRMTLVVVVVWTIQWNLKVSGVGRGAAA